MTLFTPDSHAILERCQRRLTVATVKNIIRLVSLPVVSPVHHRRLAMFRFPEKTGNGCRQPEFSVATGVHQGTSRGLKNRDDRR
jgi:hypothetical protein